LLLGVFLYYLTFAKIARVNYSSCLFHSDCVPDASAFDPDSDMAKLCHRMKKLLQEAEPPPPPSYLIDLEGSQIKETLRTLGVKVGDKVVVGGVKVSVSAIWCLFF